MAHPTKQVLALAEEIAEVVEAAQDNALDEFDVLSIADVLMRSPLVLDSASSSTEGVGDA